MRYELGGQKLEQIEASADLYFGFVAGFRPRARGETQKNT